MAIDVIIRHPPYRHSKAFKDYEAFSEKVGVFRRNLYKFVEIFGDALETVGDGNIVNFSAKMKSLYINRDKT